MCRELLRGVFEANNLVLDYVYDWTMKQVARFLSPLHISIHTHTHSAYIHTYVYICILITYIYVYDWAIKQVAPIVFPCMCLDVSIQATI